MLTKQCSPNKCCSFGTMVGRMVGRQSEQELVFMLAKLLILKPNIASFGYALFLAINAAGVWGGVFPFLPMEFQTPQIVFYFFIAQSLVFLLTYLASMLGSYFFPGATRRFYVAAASAPYFLGWALLIAAIYVDSYVPSLALPLVVAGGAFLGFGSAGLFMLWQRLFASQSSDSGNRDLIVGTVFSALLYFAFYLIPKAVTIFLIPVIFLPTFGLCIVLKSRSIDFDQPMFEDVPRKHPQIYKQVTRDYWRSAFSIGALGFCCGTMRAMAIDDPSVGFTVNILSMAGALVAALLLLFIWQSRNIMFNVSKAYRLFFPFILTAYLAIPLLGETFLNIYAGVLYAFYSCAIVLMMIQCAQASRDGGINPVFIYGLFGLIVYFLHDLGFASVALVESISFLEMPILNLRAMDMPSLTVVALVAVYLLGLMYFIGQGGFGQFRSPTRKNAENIELVALNVSVKTREEQADSKDEAEPQYRDRLSKQCAILQQKYRLTAKESEVMELICRGNSVKKIAGELVLSENTIRTHSKRIYTKLNIHKKQGLLDLVEEVGSSWQ